MPTPATNRLLTKLAGLKHQFDPQQPEKILALLKRLANHFQTDADSLITFHETLLFLRAYPQTSAVARAAEIQLRTMPKRVASLRDAGADLSPLEHPEMSGIAGTSVIDTFSFDIVRWLANLHSSRSEFYWDWFEDENRLAETWPRFMPLLEDDAFVEANVPYREWLKAARGGQKELQWLLERFDSLSLNEREKAELYNSLKLYVRWSPAYQTSRTGLRLSASLSEQSIFYHQGPMIQRRDVSFREELEKPAPLLEKLSADQGRLALDLAREASTIRYRELYGFTHGDPKLVFKANLGRGVELFLAGVPAGTRLPLRAYHAAMIYKNRVPVGYFEGISLCERMESGFNFYYTFREGETAWIYARILNVFRHLLGVTSFSIDPYQIGYENEEGIESGAFWFYRKLGFRPMKPALLKLARHEELKLASRENYRTSAATLRKLAGGPMIFELDRHRAGDWDQFQVRRIGLTVQRQMAAEFDGDAETIRQQTSRQVERTLGIDTALWKKPELSVFRDFSLVLSLIPDLHSWNIDEKQDVVRVIQAKAGSDEAKYLMLTQHHKRLRKAIIRLGS